MHTSTFRRITVVAALLAAGAAGAQTTYPGTSRRAPTPPGVPPPAQPQPPTATPPATPQPAPAPAPTATPPAGTAGQTLDDAQKQILGALHLRYAFDVDAGQLAATQGQAQQVKDLGQKLADDARRLDGELAGIARERGGDINAIAVPENERSKHGDKMTRLRGLQGRDFDRELVRAEIENQNQNTEDLKRMRDRTPGKDARLKKWLDDAENVGEAHLLQARQAKQALDAQRAAQR
jgi:putative membrane protein